MNPVVLVLAILFMIGALCADTFNDKVIALLWSITMMVAALVDKALEK